MSRLLMLRDRLRGHPGKDAGEVEPGIRIARHRIPSGGNRLSAVMVEPAARPTRACVLICHGIGETVEHWQAVQRLLAHNDVASLVFNYSGYARSTGAVHADQCERDAVEAFGYLKRLTGSETISLLGYSMGSGIAAAVASRLEAHRLILCAAFTSLREAARSMGVPKVLTSLLPAIWNTEAALRTCTVPVLIAHGLEDRLFPVKMARDLANACSPSCELILVPGLSHNAPIYNPDMHYWSRIIARL